MSLTFQESIKIYKKIGKNRWGDILYDKTPLVISNVDVSDDEIHVYYSDFAIDDSFLNARVIDDNQTRFYIDSYKSEEDGSFTLKIRDSEIQEET